MYGWRARVGLISPSRGDTLIYEFCKMSPDGVVPVLATLGVQRLSTDQLSAVLDRYEAAVRELVYEECDVINLGGTPPVTSGPPGTEETLLERARAVAGVPVFSHVQAEVEAIRIAGMSRVAVVAPYTHELTAKIEAYLRLKGINVVAVKSLGIERNVEMAKLPVYASYRLAREAYREQEHPEVDGVHLTCPRWATVVNLQRLEQDLGVPVTSSSQAIAFGALWRMGIRDRIAGFGSLLEKLATVPPFRHADAEARRPATE
jgi:maleate isomerase